jgi:hypothetical protein
MHLSDLERRLEEPHLQIRQRLHANPGYTATAQLRKIVVGHHPQSRLLGERFESLKDAFHNMSPRPAYKTPE